MSRAAWGQLCGEPVRDQTRLARHAESPAWQGNPSRRGPSTSDADSVICDYACCTRRPTTKADGWSFCSAHVREHYRMLLEDEDYTQARDEAERNYAGSLRPSGSFAAVLAVLSRRKAVKAA